MCGDLKLAIFIASYWVLKSSMLDIYFRDKNRGARDILSREVAKTLRLGVVRLDLPEFT